SSLPCSRSSSARRSQGSGLPADVLEQIVPRFDERVSPLLLEPSGQRGHVHPRGGEPGHDLLRVAALRGEEPGTKPKTGFAGRRRRRVREPRPPVLPDTCLQRLGRSDALDSWREACYVAKLRHRPYWVDHEGYLA